jgi:hypothetical protein
MKGNPVSKQAQQAIEMMEFGGEKVFFVSENLFHHLWQTDVRGVFWRDVKLPYDRMCVEFPLPVMVDGTETHGIIVGMSRDAKNDLGLNIAFNLYAIRKASEFVAGPHYVDIGALSDDGPVKSIVDVITKEEDERSPILPLLNFLINFSLYMKSEHAEARLECWADIDPSILKRRGKDRSIWVKEKKKSFVLSTIVGETIKIDPRMRAHSRECLSAGMSISVKFMVRGHWRHQWMGSDSQGNRRQELIWIQPFWKGDPLSEYVNRPYELVGG